MNAVPSASEPHRPVLYQETIEYLAPISPRSYLDCTAGAGGHSEGILQASSPDGKLIALDLDPLAHPTSMGRHLFAGGGWRSSCSRALPFN